MRVAGEIGKEAPKRPIDDRGRRRPLDLGEAPLELVETGAPAFVDARRLRGRADEEAREEVRERGMMLPVGDERAQEIGAAQERAVGRSRAAERHVVPAARAGVPAVEHELLGAEARRPCRLVERRRALLEILPARRRVHVHFDDAGVGRDLDRAQRGRARRVVAFHQHRHGEVGGGRFDRAEQLGVRLERVERRHEHVEPTAARLETERGLRDANPGRVAPTNALDHVGGERPARLLRPGRACHLRRCDDLLAFDLRTRGEVRHRQTEPHRRATGR